MRFLRSQGSGHGSGTRVLAVGGTHVFEGAMPCTLMNAEPEGAVRDLKWVDALAVEADTDAVAKVECGGETLSVKFVTPARLEVEIEGDPKTADVKVNEPFRVRARLYDNRGSELEVGKFTSFDWTASGVLEVANDRSAGEFGFGDTCYGMYGWRATERGQGTIEARLHELVGTLTVVAGS